MECVAHIVGLTADTFEKVWDDKGCLTLDHVDIPLINKSGPYYTCATLLPGNCFINIYYWHIYFILL